MRYALATITAAFIATGCGAGKTYVDEQIQAAEQRLSTDFSSGQSSQDSRIGGVSKTAQDALDRANTAGKLAKGRFQCETILSNDQVKFDTDMALLSESGRSALDAFANELKNEDELCFVEVQGHTDGTGEELHNLELGNERALSVLRYLHLEHGFPLHRMSVFSYGESMPVAGNDSSVGRAANRRVALVVLR